MSQMKRTDDFLRQVRDLLGPDACVGWNGRIGMLAAFPTSDFDQRPYVIAGTEEALIQAIREKQSAKQESFGV